MPGTIGSNESKLALCEPPVNDRITIKVTTEEGLEIEKAAVMEGVTIFRLGRYVLVAVPNAD